jgi:hypothetical protein
MVPKVFEKSDINSVSIKLTALYFFNITDLIITNFLLQTGMFVEANKIMINVIGSTTASTLIKIILPLILIVMLRYRLTGASSIQLARGNIMINLVLLFYIVVNIFHVIWIFTYYLLR